MESPFLTEGLGRGLINLSELARQLQPQLETDLWKPVGQAAVVMALRRLSERLPAQRVAEGGELALARKTGELTTRTDLALHTFRYSEHTYACQRELLARATLERGSFINVTRGIHEVMVVCSRQLSTLVDEVFMSERQLARRDNLSGVTLHLDPDTSCTPGIYHGILKQLAWDKVNVVNMICTHSELTVLLEQKQTGAAISVLSRLITQ